MNRKSLNMRDVSEKDSSLRTASAVGYITVSEDILTMIESGTVPKGDVLTVAEAAAIASVKAVPFIIPMCHNISLTCCKVQCIPENGSIKVASEVKAYDKTGVEMEAITAVSVALLNIYDMLKPMDKNMEITCIKLMKKTGGKSGDYERAD